MKSDKPWVKALAINMMERHRDYYPVDALDPEGCFYNNQIGNCGLDCPKYISGNCEIEDEINEVTDI